MSETPSFVSCAKLHEFHLKLLSPTQISAVQAFFVGCGESDTWNSWMRPARWPPLGALSVFDENGPFATQEFRFPMAARPAALVAYSSVMLVELRCSKRLVSEVILRCTPGPWGLAAMTVADRPFADSPDCEIPPSEPPLLRPQPQLFSDGDFLAQALLRRTLLRGTLDTDPTLDDLFELVRPYRGGALLGIPEGPIAYQLWNGGLVLPPSAAAEAETLSGGDRVLLRLRINGRSLQGVSQRLGDGYKPMGQVELAADGLAITETAFIDAQSTLQIRLLAKNSSVDALSLSLQAVTARRITAQNDRALYAEVQTPIGCQLLADCAPAAAKDATVTQAELRLSQDFSGDAPCFALRANTSCELHLRLPLPTKTVPRAVPSDDEFLAAGAQLDLPDSHLMNLWRALLLQTRLFVRDGVMRYGLFPGVYEDALFGIEEGWNLVSLAQYGHGAAAMEILERTFYAAEFLKKDGPHHQYRNGLALTYALDVHALTGDVHFLQRLWPTLRDSAMWLRQAFASTRTLENGQRPPHYGLMPRHIYGGDLRTPAYSLYASSACWRGLRDAGRVATILAEEPEATAWLADAAAVRADLWTAAERIYRADAQPPFLPFRTDETANSPSSGDYYQLFASLVLETAAFGWRGRWARTLTEYLEATGRQVLGLPRFDGWFERLGIDAEYARGCQLAALQRREFARFYRGMLAQIGLSCDPYTFVSPETAVIRFTQEEQIERMQALATQACRADSDPCSAGTGVMLQYLRHMLVTEERDEDDLPTGTLWLSPAAPQAYFAPGQSFAVKKLPTLYGPLSFRCTTDANWIVYELISPCPLDIEVFYRDSDAQRRSSRVRADGPTRLTLRRS